MRRLRTFRASLHALLSLCLMLPVACSDGGTVTPPPKNSDSGPIDVPTNDLGPADTGPIVDSPPVDNAAPLDVVSDAALDAPDDAVAPADAPPPKDAPAPVDALPPGHCTSTADCMGSPTPVCDTAAMRCVACTPTMDQCPPAQHCGADNTCVAGCRADEGCAGTVGRTRCDVATHACVECAESSHCGAGRLCAGGLCVAGCNATSPCPSGEVCCAGACVTTATNVAHCGACETRCTATNGTPSCTSGTCGIGRCQEPFADCDGMAASGCEVDTSDAVAHCGRCGNACATRPHTVTTCAVGACVYACQAGFADCNMNPADGCEVDLNTTTAHCGGCGAACAPVNGVGACAMGRCTVATCSAGFADCNMNPADGCEVDTRATVAHCGACGRACAVGTNAVPNCVAGTCRTTCAAGFAECDGDDANGCEVDTRVNATHCGGCGRTCSTAGGAAACVGSVCTVTSCTAGLGNCDMSAANGCEVDLRTTVTHCGACGTECSAPAAATATCAGGTCGFTCNAGFGDCDGMAANGCETNLRTAASHCGMCGRACSFSNGAATCVAGACALGTCSAGFANCNASEADGCEAVLSRVTTAPTALRYFVGMGSALDQVPSDNISVEVGPRNEIYVLGYTARIIVFDQNGVYLRNYPAMGWSTSWALAVDRASGEMWVGDPNTNAVVHLDVNGLPLQTWSAGLSGVRGVEFRSDRVYVSDYGNNRVVVYDRVGMQQRTFTSAGLSNPRGLAFGASGNIYVTSAGNNTLRVYSPEGVEQRAFTTCATPGDVTVDECRGVAYVLCEAGDQWVAHRLPDGAQLYSVPMAGSTSHHGIVLSPDGSRLYVSESHGNRRTAIYQF